MHPQQLQQEHSAPASGPAAYHHQDNVVADQNADHAVVRENSPPARYDSPVDDRQANDNDASGDEDECDSSYQNQYSINGTMVVKSTPQPDHHNHRLRFKVGLPLSNNEINLYNQRENVMNSPTVSRYSASHHNQAKHHAQQMTSSNGFPHQPPAFYSMPSHQSNPVHVNPNGLIAQHAAPLVPPSVFYQQTRPGNVAVGGGPHPHHGGIMNVAHPNQPHVHHGGHIGFDVDGQVPVHNSELYWPENPGQDQLNLSQSQHSHTPTSFKMTSSPFNNDGRHQNKDTTGGAVSYSRYDPLKLEQQDSAPQVMVHQHHHRRSKDGHHIVSGPPQSQSHVQHQQQPETDLINEEGDDQEDQGQINQDNRGEGPADQHHGAAQRGQSTHVDQFKGGHTERGPYSYHQKAHVGQRSSNVHQQKEDLDERVDHVQGQNVEDQSHLPGKDMAFDSPGRVTRQHLENQQLQHHHGQLHPSTSNRQRQSKFQQQNNQSQLRMAAQNNDQLMRQRFSGRNKEVHASGKPQSNSPGKQTPQKFDQQRMAVDTLVQQKSGGDHEAGITAGASGSALPVINDQRSSGQTGSQQNQRELTIGTPPTTKQGTTTNREETNTMGGLLQSGEKTSRQTLIHGGGNSMSDDRQNSDALRAPNNRKAGGVRDPKAQKMPSVPGKYMQSRSSVQHNQSGRPRPDEGASMQHQTELYKEHHEEDEDRLHDEASCRMPVKHQSRSQIDPTTSQNHNQQAVSQRHEQQPTVSGKYKRSQLPASSGEGSPGRLAGQHAMGGLSGTHMRSVNRQSSYAEPGRPPSLSRPDQRRAHLSHSQSRAGPSIMHQRQPTVQQKKQSKKQAEQHHQRDAAAAEQPMASSNQNHAPSPPAGYHHLQQMPHHPHPHFYDPAYYGGPLPPHGMMPPMDSHHHAAMMHAHHVAPYRGAHSQMSMTPHFFPGHGMVPPAHEQQHMQAPHYPYLGPPPHPMGHYPGAANHHHYLQGRAGGAGGGKPEDNSGHLPPPPYMHEYPYGGGYPPMMLPHHPHGQMHPGHHHHPAYAHHPSLYGHPMPQHPAMRGCGNPYCQGCPNDHPGHHGPPITPGQPESMGSSMSRVEDDPESPQYGRGGPAAAQQSRRKPPAAVQGNDRHQRRQSSAQYQQQDRYRMQGSSSKPHRQLHYHLGHVPGGGQSEMPMMHHHGHNHQYQQHRGGEDEEEEMDEQDSFRSPPNHHNAHQQQMMLQNRNQQQQSYTPSDNRSLSNATSLNNYQQKCAPPLHSNASHSNRRDQKTNSKFTARMNRTLQQAQDTDQTPQHISSSAKQTSTVKRKFQQSGSGLMANDTPLLSRMLPPSLSPAPRSHAEVLTSNHKSAVESMLTNQRSAERQRHLQASAEQQRQLSDASPMRGATQNNHHNQRLSGRSPLQNYEHGIKTTGANHRTPQEHNQNSRQHKAPQHMLDQPQSLQNSEKRQQEMSNDADFRETPRSLFGRKAASGLITGHGSAQQVVESGIMAARDDDVYIAHQQNTAGDSSLPRLANQESEVKMLSSAEKKDSTMQHQMGASNRNASGILSSSRIGGNTRDKSSQPQPGMMKLQENLTAHHTSQTISSHHSAEEVKLPIEIKNQDSYAPTSSSQAHPVPGQSPSSSRGIVALEHQ